MPDLHPASTRAAERCGQFADEGNRSLSGKDKCVGKGLGLASATDRLNEG